jgi:hypothetical protein
VGFNEPSEKGRQGVRPASRRHQDVREAIVRQQGCQFDPRWEQPNLNISSPNARNTDICGRPQPKQLGSGISFRRLVTDAAPRK